MCSPTVGAVHEPPPRFLVSVLDLAIAEQVAQRQPCSSATVSEQAKAFKLPRRIDGPDMTPRLGTRKTLQRSTDLRDSGTCDGRLRRALRLGACGAVSACSPGTVRAAVERADPGTSEADPAARLEALISDGSDQPPPTVPCRGVVHRSRHVVE